MLASTQLFNVFRIAVPLILFFGTVVYFTTSPATYNQYLRKFKDQKELFINDFLEHEIDGQVDGSSIADLCRRTTWTPGLFLSCESPAGGVGNVKNAHLNCIRFAIEMGAELILPGIIQRDKNNIGLFSPDAKAAIRGQEMDYFFDTYHLNASLATYCPQLRVHRSLNDLWEVSSLLTATKFDVHELDLKLVNGSIIAEPDLISTHIKAFVTKVSPPSKRKHPVRFHLKVTNWVWPTESDGTAFARNFGRILRIRTDVRRLAAAALFNLHQRFDLRIDPRQGLRNDSFVGVHLRTEADTFNQNEYPSYEEQAAYYIDYAVRSRNPIVYLATGASEENITAFAERAKDFGITTVLKQDILAEPEEKALLNRFTYDQRALVDYEVMLRAGLMTGTSASPFAWNLAMRRRNAYGGASLVATTAADYVQFEDRYSAIFGKSDEGRVFQATIWP